MSAVCGGWMGRIVLIGILFSPSIDAYFNHHKDVVIFVGFPKSGTTSYTEFFVKKMKLRTAHYAHFSRNGTLYPSDCDLIDFPIPEVSLSSGVTWRSLGAHAGWCSFGELVQAAIANGLPPFYYLFDKLKYKVLTQYDFDRQGIFPQVDALHEIVSAYPNAFYIHNIRDLDDHTNSIVAWRKFPAFLNRSGLLGRYPGQSPSQSVQKNVHALLLHSRKVVNDTFRGDNDKKYRFIELDLGDGLSMQKLIHFLGFRQNKLKLLLPHLNPNHKKNRTLVDTDSIYHTIRS